MPFDKKSFMARTTFNEISAYSVPVLGLQDGHGGTNGGVGGTNYLRHETEKGGRSLAPPYYP